MRLTATITPIADLTDAIRAEMWSLFADTYADVDRDSFERDLAAKDHVILLTDGPLVRGFSTVVREHRRLASGRAAVVVFSGDTVIHADYRGQTALQWAFFRYIVATKLRWPQRLVVWYLISKGYKTYLLLSRNFTCFFPRRDAGTPDWARALIDELSLARFPDSYDAASGLLRFGAPHGRLKPGVAPVEGEPDPDVRFFSARNPGHADGDELCCIGVVNTRLILAWPLKQVRRLTASGR